MRPVLGFILTGVSKTVEAIGRKASLSRRIGWLGWCKWVPWPVWAALVYQSRPPHHLFGVTMVFGGLVCVLLSAALHAWAQSLRRQFIREAPLPRYLGAKLCTQYPQLTARDAELVLRGLRQFFLAYSRANQRFVGMPSQVVDAAWHEFILHTRGYAAWCDTAFGRLLHHTPAEVLGRDAKRNDGLRRTWYWCCKDEGINPRQPSRLPLLFALDSKFAIAGGYRYVPDCKDIDRQSKDGSYCGTSFGGDGGGSSGDGAPGDANGFGGSEGSGGSDGASDGGCGGGCGGD